MEKEIIDDVLNELYSFYEGDYSLRSCVYIHPMFYNGTFCKNNCYQPDEPEPFLTKEDFIKLISEEPRSIWGVSFQVLYSHIMKEK